MSAHGLRVSLGGDRPVVLRPEDALGEGGEAIVYRAGAAALKIYRLPTPERARKLHALLALAPALPDEAHAPRDLVYSAAKNAAGQVVGFSMPLLPPGVEPLAVLSRKAFRAARSLGGADVAATFERLGRAVRVVHAAGAVVGDLSDQNELFDEARVALVDVDSFQLPGFPCEVATEAFLDPRLYGPNPAAPALLPTGSRTFDRASDWWAFAVLLFRSLTLVHPFGGVDPSCPTVARRALAGRSVFSEGVRLPPGAEARIAGLPAASLAVFQRLFEGGSRDVPPELPASLAASLTTCSCGVDHERGRACPACARVVVLPARRAGLSHDLLFEAPGAILALAAAGRHLRLVVAEGGEAVLYTFVVGDRSPRRAVLGRLSRRLFVALGPHACALEREGGLASSFTLGEAGPTERCETAVTAFAGPMPAVAAARGTFRVCGPMILGGAPGPGGLIEEPIAQAIEGQTWIAAGLGGGHECVGGATRALGARQYFLARPGHVDLRPAPLEAGEALIHEGLAFGPKHVVLHRSTELRASRLRRDVFELDGRLASSAVLPGGAPFVPSVLVGESSLLRATDAGLLREPLDPSRPSRLFDAAAAFVAEDALLASLGEHLVVAHGRAVTLLRIV